MGTIDSEAFEPGEGSIEGCDLGGSGCANNVNAQLEGVTIITLTEDDWLPDGFDNQFNDPGGFNVFLFR